MAEIGAGSVSERVTARMHRAHDASEADIAVLAHQRRVAQPLTEAEIAQTIACDGRSAWDRARIAALAREIASRTAT